MTFLQWFPSCRMWVLTLISYFLTPPPCHTWPLILLSQTKKWQSISRFLEMNNFLVKNKGLGLFLVTLWPFYLEGERLATIENKVICKYFSLINDTNREKLFYLIQYKNSCLAASYLFHIFTQPIKFYTFHYHLRMCRCLKNVIHEIDSKDEWLLLSASFTQNLGWFLS